MSISCVSCGGLILNDITHNISNVCRTCFQKKQVLKIEDKIDILKKRSIRLKNFFEWKLSIMHHNNMYLMKETGNYIIIELNVDQLIKHYEKNQGLCEKTLHKMTMYNQRSYNAEAKNNITIELIDNNKGYKIDNIRLCGYTVSSVTFSPLEHINEYVIIARSAVLMRLQNQTIFVEPRPMIQSIQSTHFLNLPQPSVSGQVINSTQITQLMNTTQPNETPETSEIAELRRRLFMRSKYLYISMFDADGTLRDFDEFLQITNLLKSKSE